MKKKLILGLGAGASLTGVDLAATKVLLSKKKNNEAEEETEEVKTEKTKEELQEEAYNKYLKELEDDSKEVMDKIHNDFIVNVEKYEYTPCYDSIWLVTFKLEDGSEERIKVVRFDNQDNREMAELLNKCKNVSDIEKLSVKVWYD